METVFKAQLQFILSKTQAQHLNLTIIELTLKTLEYGPKYSGFK